MILDRNIYYTVVYQTLYRDGVRVFTSGSHIEKPEVGNVTSKCNGFTRYRFCLVVRAITLRSDNGLNVTKAITFSSDNGFFTPRAIITFRSNNVSPQHNTLCNKDKM